MPKTPDCRMVKVLFVCLGNICRSPMAEGLFVHLVSKAGLSDEIRVDSCGTGGWHAGEKADGRMRETARKHGIELTSIARQIRYSDFAEFTYIITMDYSNHGDVMTLRDQAPGAVSQVFLMRDFDEQGEGQGVPDPYYGGRDGFEEVYQMLLRSCRELLAYIRSEHQL
jgi:protein-tyrosine phosphatase